MPPAPPAPLPGFVVGAQGSPTAALLQRCGIAHVATIAQAGDPHNRVHVAITSDPQEGKWSLEHVELPAQPTAMCSLAGVADPTTVVGTANGSVRVVCVTDTTEVLPFEGNLRKPVLSLCATGTERVFGTTVAGEAFSFSLDEDRRLEPERCETLRGLGGLPVGDLNPSPTSAHTVFGVTEHAVVCIDFRTLTIVQCWRWEPHDTLRCISARDSSIIAGAQSGRAVLWDVRSSNVTGSTTSVGGPFAAMRPCGHASFVSATAGGLLHLWRRTAGSLRSVAVAADAEGPSAGDGFHFTASPLPTVSGPSIPTPASVVTALAAADDVVIAPTVSGVVGAYSVGEDA